MNQSYSSHTKATNASDGKVTVNNYLSLQIADKPPTFAVGLISKVMLNLWFQK